jgi:uncharacterized protein
MKIKSTHTALIPIGIYLMIYVLLMFLAGCRDKGPVSLDYPIKPVAFTNVKVTDDFWARRMLTNHRVTIPIAFRKAEETGRIDNFRIAGGQKEGSFCSLYPFDDSDVYKNIEAACYSMQIYPDPALDAYLDSLIGFIAAAQEADGYLYTNRTIDPDNTHEMAGKQRWEKEEESSHELYNAGHLYEAAVAHYQATGKRSLLEVAIKNANLIDSLFGWGKIEKAPGHQEIEIGLVKLFRITGERKYLDLAKFFLDVRGPNGDEYNQMHKKVFEQKTAVGHAVRAQYMYAAMADIAALTGEKAYLNAIDTLWSDVVTGKTYITGGIGSVGSHEGFGDPYDLPNMEAYCETCAAIANALWNYRMFLLHGESKYFDVFEKVLYNGLLSGVSLSGDQFFYPNPLASNGQYSRKPWFGCACCPVNITRFLPSIPGYIYAVDGDRLFLNLFIGNEASINIKGHDIKLLQSTNYPWDGEIRLEIITDKPLAFNMLVRIPGWARNEAFPKDLYFFDDIDTGQTAIILNGEKINIVQKNGYASIDRKWVNGDKLAISFPMMPMKVRANKLVKADSGQVAFQRGPIIYCAESIDQKFPDVKNLTSDENAVVLYNYQPGLLNGVGTLEENIKTSSGQTTGSATPVVRNFLVIPYYAWANRGQGEMTVWFPAFYPTDLP